jgi:hypothetical protein
MQKDFVRNNKNLKTRWLRENVSGSARKLQRLIIEFSDSKILRSFSNHRKISPESRCKLML